MWKFYSIKNSMWKLNPLAPCTLDSHINIHVCKIWQGVDFTDKFFSRTFKKFCRKQSSTGNEDISLVA